MTVLRPRARKSVDSLAGSLQGTTWAALVSQLRDGEADISLPRFKLEWERVLIPDLQSLGMHDAFVEGGADFTRLSPLGKRLFINVVKQKTYVDVNEEGTEAAAVTNVGVRPASAPAAVVI